jgi:hypothetical protein
MGSLQTLRQGPHAPYCPSKLAGYVRVGCLNNLGRGCCAAAHFFESMQFQFFIALCITANFATNAWEAELNGTLVDENGKESLAQGYLNNIDMFFTVVFTVELGINMYAHLFWKFVTDGWSLFDFLVVSISLVSLSNKEVSNVSVFRLMRAFRVIRIFGRIKSVKSIINAITASIIPVINAFFIAFIVLALFAIIAVTLFEKDSPQEFGNLSRSFISMFRIAGGETWAESIPTVYVLEDGSEHVNWRFG